VDKDFSITMIVTYVNLAVILAFIVKLRIIIKPVEIAMMENIL